MLVDHLVPGSKESRIAAEVRDPCVKVVGHPYVDVWQAVKPASLGIAGWPSVPQGHAVEGRRLRCARLGRACRRAGAGSARPCSSYADLEPALLGRVEELIDFVTA